MSDGPSSDYAPLAKGALISGRFRLETELGHGSFADVWLVRDETGQLDRQTGLALKIYRPDLQGTAACQQCFQRETTAAQAAGRHAVLATALAAVQVSALEAALPALLLPYARGIPLATWLERRRGATGDWQCRLRLLRGLLDGLANLHSRGIAHLDLSFGNVLVEDEFPTLIDFGRAAAPSVGWPEARIHVSPFYSRCDPGRAVATAATEDVYAFAVLAFLVLSERHPLTDDWQWMLRGSGHAEEPHGRLAPRALPSLAPWLPPPLLQLLDRGLQRALAADYALRPSAAELLAIWPSSMGQQDERH